MSDTPTPEAEAPASDQTWAEQRFAQSYPNADATKADDEDASSP